MRYELKKLLWRKELWVVLLLMLIVGGMAVRGGKEYIVTEMTKPYREKTAQYMGISLTEAEDMLVAELDALSGETEDSPHWYERCVVENFHYSIEQYHRRDEEKAQMLAQIGAYAAGTEYAKRDAVYAIRLYDRPIQDMLCDRNALDMALSETGGSNLGGNGTLICAGMYLVLVCVLTAPLFACEHESGMYQILYAARRGQAGLYRRKLACGMLAVALLAGCFTVLLYIVEWLRFGLSLPVCSAPVQCTDLLAKCPYLLNIWQYILLHFGVYLLCGWMVLGISAICGGCCKTALAVFTGTAGISALLLLPPVLLHNQPAVLRLAKQTGMLRLMFLNDYLAQYESVNVCGYPIPQVLLSVVATIFLTAFLMTAGYAIYTRKGR